MRSLRSRTLLAVLFAHCVYLLAAPSIAWATKTGFPFWTITTKGATTSGFSQTGSFSLQTSYDGENTAVAGDTYLIGNGHSAQTIANSLATALNESPQKNYWTFTAVQDPKVADRWNVRAIPAAGLTATPKAIYVKAGLNDGVKSVKVSSGVDPLMGIASYQLTGTAAGNGMVSLGIQGLIFSVPTYDLGNGAPLSVLQIEQNLLSSLQSGGFPQSYLDSNSGILSIPNITTGDPDSGDGLDVGAFLSNDGDTGALVTSADITVVPEPAAFTLLAVGALGLIAYRRFAPAAVR